MTIIFMRRVEKVNEFVMGLSLCSVLYIFLEVLVSHGFSHLIFIKVSWSHVD